MSEHPAQSHGERLLIRAIRVLALQAPCPGMAAHFEAACGCAGGSAFHALEAFLQQLARHGRRRLALAVPSDPRLTADETLILEAFASAQAGDYRGLDAALTGLLGARPTAPLGGAACLVADTFELNGLILPRAAPACPALRIAAGRSQAMPASRRCARLA